MKMRKITILCLLLLAIASHAQLSRLSEGMELSATFSGVTSSGDYTPFWFLHNRHGLIAEQPNSALVGVGVKRDLQNDSTRAWRIGYGADIYDVIAHDNGHVVLQQAYIDVKWKQFLLTAGQKVRGSELKNDALSTGGLTLGTNTRPLPQLRIEVPDFWTIPHTKGWLALRGHIAYGCYTDNKWQRDFVGDVNSLYSSDSKFHSKAGFLRIGNTDKFPVTLTGGLEVACQFGGKAYNMYDRDGTRFDYPVQLASGLKQYLDAFIMGGSDVNDGEPFANVNGNQIGSWHLRADYKSKGWGVSAYAEHQFDDHSQLFMQYEWKDMLYGVEVNLPCRYVSTILYEHYNSMDQSGPIYHDHTAAVPDQISAQDNYYAHHTYGSWQHAGQVMGNPLILSPLYNKYGMNEDFSTMGSLSIYHNRIKANHFGIMGTPLSGITYRVLYTHTRSIGTYSNPTANPLNAYMWLAEVACTPRFLPCCTLTASYAQNTGALLAKTRAGMINIQFRY